LLFKFSIFVLLLCFLATVKMNLIRSDDLDLSITQCLSDVHFVTLCKPAPYRNSLTYLLTYLLRRRGNSKLKEHCDADTCEPHATACVVVPWESRVM